MNDSLKVQCSRTLFRTGTKVGGRYPTTSSHFSAQQDMLPAKNMIATQARKNKRRHAFSGVHGKPAIERVRKPIYTAIVSGITHMPSIGEP
jgi:hypothetical protein